MSKTYSNDYANDLRDLTEEKYNLRDERRLRFERNGGDTYIDWLAYRIFKAGSNARLASSNTNGVGNVKDWFAKLPGETWADQAYRLIAIVPDVCPVLGTEWDVSGNGSGIKGNRNPRALSIHHMPNGHMVFISNDANTMIGDRDASALWRMYRTCKDHGNYIGARKMKAVAQWVSENHRSVA